jgi:hypothetical protein
MPKINNPNGKKGSQAHDSYIEELLNAIHQTVDENSGKVITATREFPVATPKGKKILRFLDIGGTIDQDEEVELVKLVQVGLSDQNDMPIEREQEAIDDIEKATKKKVEFYDYKKKKKIR